MRCRLPMPARSKPLGVTESTSISVSTQRMVTPSTWVNENRKYFGIGQQWWARSAIIDKEQGHLKNTYKKKNEIPPDEEIALMEEVGNLRRNTTLFSERDVIKAAEKLIVDPVENVVQHLFPKLEIRTRTEKSESTSRIDVVWEILRPGTAFNEPKNWIECAILEFKNTNIIKFEHFKYGQVGRRDEAGKIVTETEAREIAEQQRSGTLLRGNAIPLSKQARKYARRTPYVAIFDWDTMALFDFSGTNYDSNEPICPRISFFSEHDVDDAKEGEDNGLTHRMFLLGFVANAIKEKAVAAKWL